MKSLVLASLPALLAACGSAPVPPAPADAAAPVCTRETPTGSSIAVTRCRSAAETAGDADAARSAGDTIHRGRSGARAPTVQ